MKFNLRKNDVVVVKSGKYSGIKGKVLKVFPDKHKVIVEGVSFVKKHTKAGQRGLQTGGILEREAPIPMAKVMIYCSHCDRPVRIGHKILEDKSSVRICRRCNEILTEIK